MTFTGTDGPAAFPDVGEDKPTEAALREAIAVERRALALTLRDLEPEEWGVPTLCSGWGVRELVAHLTMPFRHSMLKTVLGVVKARGDFNKMADRTARADAATLSPAELTAAVADNVDHPWKPPGGGYRGALTHDVVHGLDLTVPLGLKRAVPVGSLQVALEEATSPRAIKHFGSDLAGVSLCADDTEFTFGSGSRVTGSAQDLLLVLCGRNLPAGRLRGAQAARFETA